MSTHPATVAAMAHIAQADYIQQRLATKRNLYDPTARQVLQVIRLSHMAAADELRALAKRDEIP